MADALDILLTPHVVGSLHLRNRIVMAPMTRNFSPGGVPGEPVAAYYRRRAAGGVGLIVTEGIGVDHPSAIGAGTMGEHAIPRLHGEDALAGWRAVVAGVHAAGGLIVPQLWHMGAIRLSGSGPHPEAPSARPSGIWGPIDRAALPPAYLQQVSMETSPLDEGEMIAIIEGFARSAANARACGFDGIAIHGAHGYLLDSFLWPETNRRTNRWGGGIAARTRFAVEIVRAVRAATAPEFPILFRFSQWKLQDYAARNAQTPDELAALLGPLVEAGVDVFDASTRALGVPAFEDSPLGLAGWTKRLTGKPAVAVGGVGMSRDLQSSFVEPTVMTRDLDDVAARIDAGEIDLVAVGRALLMDPEWIAKLRSGEPFRPFRLEAYATLD